MGCNASQQVANNTTPTVRNTLENLSVLSYIETPEDDMAAMDAFKDKMAQNAELAYKGKGTSAPGEPTLYKPLVVLGPSGAGKGTLIKFLIDKHTDKFGFSVSHTTRRSREGEEHGKHYFFVSHERFEEMIKEDAFIEHCHVHGNFYGTAKAQIISMQQQKIIPLLDIDVQGCLKFNKAFPETNNLCIFPPSLEKLEERLRARGTETKEMFKTRLGNAQGEMDAIIFFELFQLRISNNKLEKTFLDLVGVIYERELSKMHQETTARGQDGVRASLAMAASVAIDDDEDP